MVFSEYIFGEKPSLNIFVDSVQSFIRKHKKKSEVEEADLIGFYLES